MSLKVYTASTQKALTLELAPFAKGGEGSLYKIRSPKKYANYAAKIYHKNKRTNERQEKIKYLIGHPPQFEHPSQAAAVVWPIDLLQQNGRFVGYLMPLAKGQKLESLCTPKLPKRLGSDWKRLGFEQAEAMELRIKICFNLAVALYHIHATKHYVLVDLKADNILIRPNGLVSIVDMDSIEVVEGDKVLFPAPMATPEFTPPEFYVEKGQRQGPILETWDRFAMAIIFYKVLFGIHPFAGSSKAPFEKFVTLADKIEQGLFMQAPDMQQYFSVIPQPHEQFFRLSEGLKVLFLQCFVQGHKNPVWRPSAEDWCIALSDGSEVGLVTHRPLLSHLPAFQQMDLAPLELVVPAWGADNIYDFVLDKIDEKQRIYLKYNFFNSEQFQGAIRQIVGLSFGLIAFSFATICIYLLFFLTLQDLYFSYNLIPVLGMLLFVIPFSFACIGIFKEFKISLKVFKHKKFWKENRLIIIKQLKAANKRKLEALDQGYFAATFFYKLTKLEQLYKDLNQQNLQNSTSNIQPQKKTSLQPYQQEQDKKIIQLSKTERKALQELKEALENDATWQKFKGQNLRTKLHNVEPYYKQHNIAKLEAEVQQNYQKIDAQFNQLAEQQSKAYYQELNDIDANIKEQEKELKQQYERQLAILGNDSSIYKNVQKNLTSVQEKYKQELNALHHALTQDINGLEQQQHKNLQKLKEQTEKELQNSSAEAQKSLLAKAEKEASTLIAMTHQNIGQLKKIYQERQEKLSAQWLSQEQLLDKELLSILELFISQNREEKTLKLQLQQLQHQKRKDKILAELKFIYQRQQTIDDLQRNKQKATQEYNQALANIQQEIVQTKATLKQLKSYYNTDIKAIKEKYDAQYQAILVEAEQHILAKQLQQESDRQALQKELEQTKIELEQHILFKLDIELE